MKLVYRVFKPEYLSKQYGTPQITVGLNYAFLPHIFNEYYKNHKNNKTGKEIIYSSLFDILNVLLSFEK